MLVHVTEADGISCISRVDWSIRIFQLLLDRGIHISIRHARSKTLMGRPACDVLSSIRMMETWNDVGVEFIWALVDAWCQTQQIERDYPKQMSSDLICPFRFSFFDTISFAGIRISTITDHHNWKQQRLPLETGLFQNE
jgi:hypothetical protein